MNGARRRYAGGVLPSWLDPLLDAERMRRIDAWAISDQGVPSLQLMEAAGRALAQAAGEIAAEGPVRVVCGKGNNGGDGLVAARYLADAGFETEALLLWPAAELSGDAAANLERLGSPAREVAPGELAAALAGSGLVIDALLGTGFGGEPREPVAAAIAAINGCDAPVVAADIASGVDASTGEIAAEAVQASATVTFHSAKVGHRVAPGKAATGKLHVAAIGIPPDSPAEAGAGTMTSAVLALAPPRAAASTKFTSGQVLIAGGSRGLTGAPSLSAMASIRAGAGYATLAVPLELEAIFEAKLTEVMSVGCPSSGGAFADGAADLVIQRSEEAACVAIGPGIGRSDAAAEFARTATAAIEAPLVLDADGLNAYEGRFDELGARSAPLILTPHAGELARLLGRRSDEVSARRLASAREAAERSGAVVVLKGDDSLVVDGRSGSGPVAVNALSSPALATAGTGDVLTGTIAALIARGLDPFIAACAGVYANARAGRIVADRLGAAESVIAGDVIDALPAGLRPEEPL